MTVRTSTSTSTSKSNRRSAGAIVGNGLLTVGAIGGSLCIVLVLLAAVFHISLIMFKTGSMSPTIPAGSLALVHEIPASEVRVGEVVTIDRRGALPISHRVTSVKDAGGQSRHITMRGDANSSDDPVPYTVSTVRQVLFSIPQLAYFVVFLSDPLVLGIITVAVAALVTWAFWPRDGERAREKRHADGGRRPARGRRRAAARHSTALLSLLAVAGVLVLGSGSPAQAAPSVQTVSGPVLTLTAIGDRGQMSHLVPGVPVMWEVGVAAHPPDPGIVRLSLVGAGALVGGPSGLWLTIRSCLTRWVGGGCPGGATALLGPEAASIALADSHELLTMPSDEQRWLMFAVSLPPSDTLPSGSATLGLSAIGSGDSVTVSTGSSAGVLASTGAELWAPALTAAIAVLVGVGLSRFGRRSGRRRARWTDERGRTR